MLNQDSSSTFGLMALSWLEGYIAASQVLVGSGLGIDRVEWPVAEVDAQLTWARSYCQQHPNETVAGVATNLFWNQFFPKAKYVPPVPAPEPKKNPIGPKGERS
jgi:hypothetical protein